MQCRCRWGVEGILTYPTFDRVTRTPPISTSNPHSSSLVFIMHTFSSLRARYASRWSSRTPLALSALAEFSRSMTTNMLTSYISCQENLTRSSVGRKSSFVLGHLKWCPCDCKTRLTLLTSLMVTRYPGSRYGIAMNERWPLAGRGRR